MPPRIPRHALVRLFQATITQRRAAISNTAKNSDLKDVFRSSTANQLIDIEGGAKSSSQPEVNAAHGTPQKGNTLMNLLQKTGSWNRMTENEMQMAERSAHLANRDIVASLSTRQWETGDVYAPHDLSFAEAIKWKRPKRMKDDRLDMLGLNPLDHYKNFSIISEFMTDMGRIQHSKQTGLRPVNQRKMAKAIRRAIGMGIHPSTHKHPQIVFRGTKHGPRYQGKYATEEPVNNNVKNAKEKPDKSNNNKDRGV